MPTVDVNGTSIHYERTGTGPDLLFVHGMCGDARVWRRQVELLADRYTCTTYDRRGHSRSAGSVDGSDAVHADDEAALIEALHLEPVVVASSGGARISLELLRRRQDLVRGAVLSEPPLMSIDPDGAQQFLGELVPRVSATARDGGPPAAVDAFFSYTCPGLWSRIDEPTKDRYRSNAPAMFAEFEAQPNSITSVDLRDVHVPTMVLSGADSHPSLRAIARVVARSLAGSRFVELADCGHVTYAEQPEQFASTVATFAGDVTTTTATAY